MNIHLFILNWRKELDEISPVILLKFLQAVCLHLGE